MERNDRPWFQVQADILDSFDLNRLSDRAERIFWRLHALCCRRGVGDTIPWPREQIADRFHVSVRKLELVFAELERPGTDGEPMIEVSNNAVRIVKWHDYQPVTTSSERSRNVRKSSRRASRVVAASSQQQRGNVLEAEAEGEEEREPSTQPCPVLEMPPHVSRTDARVQVAKTDSDLVPLFEAYCRGSGQSLTWRPQHVIPTERLFAENPTPADVERIAKFYRSKLGEGTASYPRFAAEFDKWRAESAIAPKPPLPVKRDDPRMGAPSVATRNVFKQADRSGLERVRS